MAVSRRPCGKRHLPIIGDRNLPTLTQSCLRPIRRSDTDSGGDLMPSAIGDRSGNRAKEKPPPLPVRVVRDKAPGGDLLQPATGGRSSNGDANRHKDEGLPGWGGLLG